MSRRRLCTAESNPDKERKIGGAVNVSLAVWLVATTTKTKPLEPPLGSGRARSGGIVHNPPLDYDVVWSLKRQYIWLNPP